MIQKFRCWLLRRLLGDTFRIIVRANKLGYPIIPAATIMTIQPGTTGTGKLPRMIVDYPVPKEQKIREYSISFLEK